MTHRTTKIQAPFHPSHGISCWRDNGAPRTNVPTVVCQHSPDGPEWGYDGSGPADLALNYLTIAFPPRCDGKPAVKLFRGWSSAWAWEHHQELKRHFIAGIPREGGDIPGSQLVAWLWEQAVNAPPVPLPQMFMGRHVDMHFTRRSGKFLYAFDCRFCAWSAGNFDGRRKSDGQDCAAELLIHVHACSHDGLPF